MGEQALQWARQLQTLAQNGLTYARDPYDRERYETVRGMAAAMMAAQTGAAVGDVVDLFTMQAGHATPKGDVRGVVCRDDTILLVRERSDGRWTLPGGWADPGESAARATVREVYEESGYRTRAVRLLALYDRDDPRHGHPAHAFHVYKIFFLCEPLDMREAPAVGGRTPAHEETDAVAFFRLAALPALSETRVTASQIHRLFALSLHPEWPADFD